jgi:hypothetical protein
MTYTAKSTPACSACPVSAKRSWRAVVRAVLDKDGIQRVEIVGGGYFFSPNRVIVKVNVE